MDMYAEMIRDLLDLMHEMSDGTTGHNPSGAGSCMNPTCRTLVERVNTLNESARRALSERPAVTVTPST